MDSSSSGQNDPTNTTDSNQSEQETATSSKSKVKRKPVMPRSTVWDHFTKFKTDNGDTKGKCNYCNKEFCCDPKRNGTTALRNHMNICKKHPHAIETTQALLDLQPNSNNVEGEVGTLSTWKYDENAIREALVSMIIIDELTFKFVEGDAIGRAIETCLLEWGLDKIFTITVDNASSNDIAISYLKKKLANWGVTVSNSDYLHMRGMAHIVNLVVMDGLKDVGESVLKVRNAVRYIRSSPARLKKFKECVEYEKIDGKSSLCLDVSTRKMAEMFSHFYELTLRISGSRSSLTLKIVKALICAQDWTRSSNCPINVEEDLEELEKFEEGSQKLLPVVSSFEDVFGFGWTAQNQIIGNLMDFNIMFNSIVI
ncbi:hypothetical protein GH714_019458 [Hevea brasiliensis]|uniref:BED-type domain-containing protein n=1 Tax=Hevea brasiliensis TaxID=3981 RepID=A0A6A6LYM6_HEVBR|nr:hypothetical protein GH714_019458 [Hevea brasiliensis]